ncbi:MAG: YihY/virulence factor BrkB family protein [Lachnospiraceae bacterium]|nr:YihY/virulence factor BrkB family protein [Lachnospiraceae bacterium]
MSEQESKAGKKHTKLDALKDFGLGFVKSVMVKDIGTYAASTAFYTFLSLLPIMVLILFFLPKTGFSADEVIPIVTDITPDYIDSFVAQMIRETYGRAAGVLPITLILTVFSAAQGMTALIKGLRLVYGVEKKQNVVVQNLLAILSTLVIAAFLLFSALGLFFANSVVLAAAADQITIPALSSSVLKLRYIIMMALFILLLTLLYTFISGAERKLRLHLPGAVFSTVLCAVFTAFFSLFVGLGNYRTIYGNLAALVVMLIWGFSCILLVLLGGCFNKYLMDRKKGSD